MAPPEQHRVLAFGNAQAPIEVLNVPTTLGPQYVVAVGKRTLPAIVTYHEAGLTPEQTFGGFLNAPRVAELAEMFCWYHVYAPGTEPGALDWTGAYPSMDVLATQLGEVIRHVGAVPAVIFGVGAGGNVALRVASSQPDQVRGLILVGTTSTAASMQERADSMIGFLEGFVWKSSEIQHACTRLLSRFFSASTVKEFPDVVARARSNLNHMSHNMLKFVGAYDGRDDITARLKTVHASVLFVLGSESPHADVQEVTYEELNPPTVAIGLRSSGAASKSLVKVDQACDLMTEESPSDILQPLALFFVSLEVYPVELMQLDFVRDIQAVPSRRDSLLHVSSSQHIQTHPQ